MTQLQRIAIAPTQLQDTQIVLTTEQHHYLVRVLRLHPGDNFIAMDGRGKWWLARLNQLHAEIIEEIDVETELPVSVTLVAALPKGNAFDEVVRCCTELGVTYIAPVLSDRTLLQPSPQKLERWQRIAREAAEQSERSLVPTILAPAPWSKISFSTPNKYICVTRGEYPHLLNCLYNQVQFKNNNESNNIVIAIGPEGGWTPIEIANATAAGFKPVSLGRRVLRAVTASIVALSLISASCEV